MAGLTFMVAALGPAGGGQAKPLPNPFVSAQGSYAGLFAPTNSVDPSNAGYLSATVTAQGAFTCKLLLAGKSYSFSGQFLADGSGKVTSIRGSPGLSASLQLDLHGGDLLTGTIKGTNWVAGLLANRAVFSRLRPAPQGGKHYTLVISGAPEGTNQPGGCGFGTLSVDTLGNLSFTGTLGDGTNVSQSTLLSKEGEWPLFFSPYAGKGLVLGWVQFTNEAQTDFRGMVNWIKLPQPRAKYYPAGFVFTNGTEVFGSVYTNKPGRPALNWTNGLLTLQNVLLSSNMTAVTAFTFGTNNFLISVSGSDARTYQPGAQIIIPGGWNGSLSQPVLTDYGSPRDQPFLFLHVSPPFTGAVGDYVRIPSVYPPFKVVGILNGGSTLQCVNTVGGSVLFRTGTPLAQQNPPPNVLVGVLQAPVTLSTNGTAVQAAIDRSYTNSAQPAVLGSSAVTIAPLPTVTTGTGSNGLTLQVTLSTGVFQGSVGLQSTQAVAFKGVVLQKLSAGYGAYFAATGTGSAQIATPGITGPFGGLRQQVPGTIRAERFDLGGKGVQSGVSSLYRILKTAE